MVGTARRPVRQDTAWEGRGEEQGGGAVRHLLLPPPQPRAKPQGSQGRGNWCRGQGGSSEVVRVAGFWID